MAVRVPFDSPSLTAWVARPSLPLMPPRSPAQTPERKRIGQPRPAEYFSADQGYALNVPITLNTNGVDTTGTTALLRYDPGLLNVQSVTIGSLYSNAVQETADDPVAGVVRMSAYNSSSPFNGAGVFATVSFMPHHGTPGGGMFSVLEVWLEGDETYHSVVAQSVTAANQLGSVGAREDLLSLRGRCSAIQRHRIDPWV